MIALIPRVSAPISFGTLAELQSCADLSQEIVRDEAISPGKVPY